MHINTFTYVASIHAYHTHTYIHIHMWGARGRVGGVRARCGRAYVCLCVCAGVCVRARVRACVLAFFVCMCLIHLPRLSSGEIASIAARPIL